MENHSLGILGCYFCAGKN